MKAELLADRANRWVRSRQEVPAGGRLRAAISLQVRGLFRKRQRRGLSRIDAEENDFEIAARSSLDLLKRFHETICHQPAQHRTAIIARHNDNRLVVEVLIERHPFSGFVDERPPKRKLLIELLVETN